MDRWTPAVFRSAADKVFTQIASQLGLQVIAGTTFGALSERELALAMETGMPKFTKVEEYKDYLIRKRDAEQKLMREFVFYANYLRTEGYEMSAIEAQDVFNRTRASVRTEEDVQLVGTDGNPLELIQTADEFEALPSGTEYTADGISISVKP